MSELSRTIEPVVAGVSETVIVVSLTASDLISVSPFTENDPLLDVFRSMLQQHWFKGVQSETVRLERRAMTFKLRGNPFRGMLVSDEELVGSRSLIIGIFESLYHNGYLFAACLEIALEIFDEAFVFRKVPYALPRCDFFGIGVYSSDTLICHGLPSEFTAPFRSSIQLNWKKGIQSETTVYGETYFKLRGEPWNYGIITNPPDEGLNGRILLARLIGDLSTMGWQVYASVDIQIRGTGMLGFLIFNRPSGTSSNPTNAVSEKASFSIGKFEQSSAASQSTTSSSSSFTSSTSSPTSPEAKPIQQQSSTTTPIAPPPAYPPVVSLSESIMPHPPTSTASSPPPSAVAAPASTSSATTSQLHSLTIDQFPAVVDNQLEDHQATSSKKSSSKKKVALTE